MMNAHSAEKTTIALVSGESAAIGIVLESCVAGPVATLISDDGSGRRAFPIEIEVQRMSCPSANIPFQSDSIVPSAATYPRAKKTDDPGMFLMSRRTGLSKVKSTGSGNKTNGDEP